MRVWADLSNLVLQARLSEMEEISIDKLPKNL
jgi:hypothetical protein